MNDFSTSAENYFDAVYRDYAAQNPPTKLDHYVDAVEARLSVPAPQLLDIGCGRGLFLRHVQERNPAWNLFAIDVDSSGLEATSENAPKATVKTGRADSIPFADASFDVISAWDVLEHVSDLETATSEITRCLRPDGLLAVVVPVYDGVTGPLIRALDHDPTHIHQWPRRSWLGWMTANFQGVRWHGIFRYLLTSSFYLHRPTHRFRRHTPAILMSGFRE